MAVKNASTMPIETPLAELWGKDNIAAPIRIVIRKLNIIIWGGFNRRMFSLFVNRDS